MTKEIAQTDDNRNGLGIRKYMNEGNNSENGSKKAIMTKTAQVESSDLMTIHQSYLW